MKNKSMSTKQLGDVSVLNEEREEVRLSDIWKKRTAALVFVRHFG